jgi:hypothetical protein
MAQYTDRPETPKDLLTAGGGPPSATEGVDRPKGVWVRAIIALPDTGSQHVASPRESAACPTGVTEVVAMLATVEGYRSMRSNPGSNS